MDIYSYADKFLELVEKTGEGEASDVVKFAGRKNRKQLMKDLQMAKDRYTKFKASMEEKNRAAKDIAAVIDRDTKQMQSARKDVLRAYDILKNMDLIDSNEVKFRGEDVGYVKDKRIYRLEVDPTGNVTLAPFRKKKKDDDDDDAEDDDNDDDESDKAAVDDQNNADAAALYSSMIGE